MKRLVCIWVMILAMAGYGNRVLAQSQEVAQLLLNVEKLAQFKQILKDLKAGYEIIDGGYKTIKNLSEGNFNLHKTFLDGLMAVSPTVRNYKKIVDIITIQKQIVNEYKAANKRFRTVEFFTTGELDYISSVYEKLFKASLNNLDDLTMVVTANKLRMSDDERLQAINRIYEEMEDKLVFLRSFNNSTSVLAVQRAKEHNDIGTMRAVQGIN